MLASSLQEFYKHLKPNTRIMAIDVGEKKVGFAISDIGRVMSMPLCVTKFDNEKHKIKHILELISKYKICGIVLGLPLNMDSTESEQTQKARIFGTELSQIVELPIYMQDERMTTLAANSLLKSAGMNRKDRHQIDDQVAACLILESVIMAMRNCSI